ncbi:MAG: Rossmann fold nucleotide-binding protein [Terracoccus sp.]
MEIESLAALDEYLAGAAPLRGLRLQDLDLSGHGAAFASRADLNGLVVLGGVVPVDIAEVLLRRGAIVFPGVADAPIDPWRGLYLPEDLYDGLAGGYAATPDARAYAWYRDAAAQSDAYCTLIRAIHDDSVTDELDEFVAGRSVVGVMGGHALQRDSLGFGAAARLAHRLADAGHLVATGGGPGAMEAANLGAWCRTEDVLDRALTELATVPGFAGDVTHWAASALDLRAAVVGDSSPTATDPLAAGARSLGIPTWFYGHEPPNVFCDAVAKYFSNAIREDGLLRRSNAGVVVMPGAAGTVQEVFQAATPLYYAAADAPLPPLVLVGRAHWTNELPVWPALRALAAGRRMEGAIHLVDSLDEVLPLVGPIHV